MNLQRMFFLIKFRNSDSAHFYNIEYPCLSLSQDPIDRLFSWSCGIENGSGKITKTSIGHSIHPEKAYHSLATSYC